MVWVKKPPAKQAPNNSVCYCYLIWRPMMIRINVIFFSYVIVFLDFIGNSCCKTKFQRDPIKMKGMYPLSAPNPRCQRKSQGRAAAAQRPHSPPPLPVRPHSPPLPQCHGSGSWGSSGHFPGRPLGLLFSLPGSFSFRVKCHLGLFKTASNHMQPGCPTSLLSSSLKPFSLFTETPTSPLICLFTFLC